MDKKTMLSWIRAIENEDGENLSFGSIRTLGMMKKALNGAAEPLKSAPANVSLLVEFGYRQCEKGNNLETAIKNAFKVMAG